MNGASRNAQLARGLGVFAIAIPLVVLAATYAVARIVTVAFGDLLFGFTIVTAVAWVLFGLSGRRLDAARRGGEPSRNSATDYGRETSTGTYERLSGPTWVMTTLTATVAFGWLFVILG